jgi:hypothetical protein
MLPTVQYLSALSGLDDMSVEAILISALLVAFGLGRKAVAAFASGNYLTIGETAGDILKLLENVDLWSRNGTYSVNGPGRLSIDYKRREIETKGGDAHPYLNRRERRLIYAGARKVRTALSKSSTESTRLAIQQAVADARIDVLSSQM